MIVTFWVNSRSADQHQLQLPAHGHGGPDPESPPLSSRSRYLAVCMLPVAVHLEHVRRGGGYLECMHWLVWHVCRQR